MSETLRLSLRGPIIRALAAALTLAAFSDAPAQESARPAEAGAAPTVEPTIRRIAELDIPIHPSVAPSPDGRFIAVLQTRPDPVLWVVPSDGGEPFAFRKMWAAHRPRWAPSGQRIGFIAGIGPPRIWTVEIDPATGRPIDPPRLLIRTDANAFAFSPDGSRVALVASRSTAAGASEIHIVNWETRASRVLLRESGAIYWLDWSPDGKSLYYGILPQAKSGEATHAVRRIALAGGSPQAVAEAGEFLGLSPDGAYLLCRAPQPASGDGTGVVVLRIDGEPVVQLRLASDPTSLRWAADSRTLIQIQARDGGTELQEISAGSF